MRLAFILMSSMALISCQEKTVIDHNAVFNGTLSREFIQRIEGFEEQREVILGKAGVSQTDFVTLSTDSAWSMTSTKHTQLKAIRQSIESPGTATLIQKVIPLEDVAVYMNNTYGGTVGGFIAVSADVKRLSTMAEVYWGLRLDYVGTKFRATGAGYAVIRFYSDAASKLTIPFCPEMGGTQAHAWPNTCGGFTASTLGSGGYPEYVFPGYSAPNDGAELYEVTPQGREILRSVYRKGQGWQTNEIGALPVNASKTGVEIRNGVFTDTKSEKVFITTYALYHGNRYVVRGEVDGEYHLTTTTAYHGVGLEVVDKGIYGINVPVSQVQRVWEEEQKL